ncbi:hypothetical protein MKX83_03485 [Cytobacillus sp. FSL M8-0252]
MKQFKRKSRVRIPMTTPSPNEITRQKEIKELLHFLEKLKGKRFFS